jgi:hypothetical protein
MLAAGRPASAQSAGSPPTKTPNATGARSLQPATSAVPIATHPPAGFDDINQPIITLFDLDFQGRRIGAFEAVETNGTFKFSDPDAVARALGDQVLEPRVRDYLSRALPDNFALNCHPGRNVDCGILPGGTSGVIVNSDAFRVDLFLAREFLAKLAVAAPTLGNPVSGPSLIQNVAFAASSDLSGGSTDAFGATFDTLASMGRTAFVAETTIDSLNGEHTQFAYVQRVQQDTREAAGLMLAPTSANLTNLTFVGADFGSFNSSLADKNRYSATPLDILLPERARVELYRAGVLVSAKEYDGGLQLLDTTALPVGSYTVRIVVRSGSAILIDETRPFTKAGDLPPPGKTLFTVLAGERVRDYFSDPTQPQSRTGFIPSLTGEPVLGLQASHRIGQASAANFDILSVGSSLYPELGFQTYKGSFRGLADAAFSTNGQYSALISADMDWKGISAALTLRTVKANDLANQLAVASGKDPYVPFYETENEVYASVNFPLLKGYVSLLGSYVKPKLFPENYSAGVSYTRAVILPRLGTAQLSAAASVSNIESRVGFTVTFFRKLAARTNLSYSVGAEAVDSQDQTTAQSRAAPVATATVDHTDTFKGVDLVESATLSTDSQQQSAEAQLQAASGVGVADLRLNFQHDATQGNVGDLTLNAATGFAYGGGAFKFGLRSPGDAIVIVDVDKQDPGTAQADALGAASGGEGYGGAFSTGHGAEGGYRPVINNQPFGMITVGHSEAIGLPAYDNYRISLAPVGAPPFDMDLSPKTVSLYPGNVVRLKWGARRVVTAFGQVLDRAGKPVARARVAADTDITQTDDGGYFSLTAPIKTIMSVNAPDGADCLSTPIASQIDHRVSRDLVRLRPIVCNPQAAAAAR